MNKKKEDDLTPREITEKSISWWLLQLSPSQVWKLVLLTFSALAIAFNFGAWMAGTNIPFFRDLPWFPSIVSEPNKQLWLTMDDVDLVGQSQFNHYRLIIRVNGNAYSYPSRSIFMSRIDSPPKESFPLPVDIDTFDVSFEGILESDSKLISETVVRVDSFPFHAEYSLHEATNNMWSNVSAKVRFSIAER